LSLPGWIKLVVILLVLCVLGGGLIWLGIRLRAEGKPQVSQSEERVFPHLRINRIARSVTDADVSAIRELIDVVFQASRPYMVPERAIRQFKERLLRSEISYRNGGSVGVAEESIVRVIDQLADKFAAPEFARTSQEQVRELRLVLSNLMPDFIVRRPLENGATPDRDTGFTVNPIMSPVEAIYVLQDLIHQKEISDYYQLTSGEQSAVNKILQKLDESGIHLSATERTEVRMQLIHQEINKQEPRRLLEEIVALAKRHSAERGTEEKKYVLRMMPSTPRREEMQEVMERARAMRIGEAIELTHKILDDLGIER
jgi:hypothetical protein